MQNRSKYEISYDIILICEVRIKDENPLVVLGGSRDDAVVRVIASHQCGPVRFPDSASYVG